MYYVMLLRRMEKNSSWILYDEIIINIKEPVYTISLLYTNDVHNKSRCSMLYPYIHSHSSAAAAAATAAARPTSTP